LADALSTLKITHSVSDNDVLPAGKNNLLANPRFVNPNTFDFRLAAGSPCILAGTNGNIGASLKINEKPNQLYISAIAYKSDLNSEINEFFELSNSGNTVFDLSGMEFTKGITFRFPEGSKIEPGQKVYIANSNNSDFWIKTGQTVYQWESGRLADEGEAIQLISPEGIVVDYVFYNHDNSWPHVSDGEAISLKAGDLDNHFGDSWQVTALNVIVNNKNEVAGKTGFRFYPNPTTGILNVSGLETEEVLLNVYNITGVLIKSQIINSNHSQINLSDCKQGIYLLRYGNSTERIAVVK
jgi:hypothetical protein